jgi:hypothetical protein
VPLTLETVVIAQCGCKISTHLPETDISCGFSNFPGDCIDFVVDWFLWKTFISHFRIKHLSQTEQKAVVYYYCRTYYKAVRWREGG